MGYNETPTITESKMQIKNIRSAIELVVLIVSLIWAAIGIASFVKDTYYYFRNRRRNQ